MPRNEILGQGITLAIAPVSVSPRRSVAVVGTYLPRKCGIATFTSDLVGALAAEARYTDVMAVAVNDVPDGYQYPPEVRFEIDQHNLASYGLAAQYLNESRVDVTCIQHEFGIFGGIDGEYILEFIADLAMPVVTTLHTVLKDPSPSQRAVLGNLQRLSARLVVMSQTAKRFLQEVYNVPQDKIEVIPHGVPNVPLINPNFYKRLLGLERKRVVLSFGLLSPSKGIETMIRALPSIIRKQPDVLYFVLGGTHPHVKMSQGEAYRLQLRQLAENLGVAKYVVFENRFVNLGELCDFLGASDLYVTPYPHAEQIVSGTLAYAMSAGAATVSTPYWYAQEMLADGRGRIVPFEDPEALAREVIDLLEDDAEREAMRRRAYHYARRAIWSEVARRYLELFQAVRYRHALLRGSPPAGSSLEDEVAPQMPLPAA